MLEDLQSRALLRQAFERVRANGGCRGVDGVDLAQFRRDLETRLDSIQSSLLARRYHPYPLLRIPVPKTGGVGVRYLAVPTVRDRVVQSAVHLLTQEVFEAEFEEASYAYRRGRSVRQAVYRIQELRDQGYRWVVDADIDSFFDNVPHPPLLERLGNLPFDPYVLELLRRWVEAEVYDGSRIFTLTKGLPQGSVVSPSLANFFLDELDENLALFGQRVVRYSDDFLVLCKDRDRATEALEITDYLLEELELDLHSEKTRITSFDHGFKFLGALFVRSGVFLPLERKEDRRQAPKLPPPLDLLTYIELRNLES